MYREKGRVKSNIFYTYDIDKITNSSFYRAIRLELGDINNEL